MLDFLINWNRQQLDFILAPLYFHFGSYPLFIEIMVILSDFFDFLPVFFAYLMIIFPIIYLVDTLCKWLAFKFFKIEANDFYIITILFYIKSLFIDLFFMMFEFFKNIFKK